MLRPICLLAAAILGTVAPGIAARRPIEFHAFRKGEHGFGLGRPGTTTVESMDDQPARLDLNGPGRRS